MAERQGNKGIRRGIALRMLSHPDGFCGQQRLVVQRHAGAPVLRNKLLEIYLFVAENRRPEKRCRARINQPLAADRDLENIMTVDA